MAYQAPSRRRLAYDEFLAGQLSLALVRQVEDALCAATVFTESQANEPFSSIDADREPALYGCIQDFDIWAAR